jgi:hypothetical protein
VLMAKMHADLIALASGRCRARILAGTDVDAVVESKLGGGGFNFAPRFASLSYDRSV